MAQEKEKEVLPLKNSSVPPTIYQRASDNGWDERTAFRRTAMYVEKLEDRIVDLERKVDLLQRQQDLTGRQMQTLMDMFVDRLAPKKKK